MAQKDEGEEEVEEEEEEKEEVEEEEEEEKEEEEEEEEEEGMNLNDKLWADSALICIARYFSLYKEARRKEGGSEKKNVSHGARFLRASFL